MTTLLKNVVRRLQSLPRDRQDFYARQFLRELEEEQPAPGRRMTDDEFEAFFEEVLAVAAKEPDRSEGALKEFREAADALGEQAQANGWNDELDAKLLRGDLDHD